MRAERRVADQPHGQRVPWHHRTDHSTGAGVHADGPRLGVGGAGGRGGSGAVGVARRGMINESATSRNEGPHSGPCMLSTLVKIEAPRI